ncbi:hypothetical protein PCE1_004508 [Barthelona sp. PCE]
MSKIGILTQQIADFNAFMPSLTEQGFKILEKRNIMIARTHPLYPRLTFPGYIRTLPVLEVILEGEIDPNLPFPHSTFEPEDLLQSTTPTCRQVLDKLLPDIGEEKSEYLLENVYPTLVPIMEGLLNRVFERSENLENLVADTVHDLEWIAVELVRKSVQ